MTDSVKSILEMMNAENLLEGSALIARLQSFPNLLTCKLDGKVISFDDYYAMISQRIEALPRLKLSPIIPDNQGDRYIAELIEALDELQDQMQTVEKLTVNFLARLKDAESDSAVMSSEFEAWYILAATDLLNSSGTKLPSQNLKAIARSEFTRLIGGASVNINSLTEAVKILQQQIKTKQKMAKDKFVLGEKQATATWANNLPTGFGINPDSRPGSILDSSYIDEDEEELPFIPAYVSKLNPPTNEDTTEESAAASAPVEEEPIDTEHTPEEEPGDAIGIIKYGDAKPVTVLSPEEALARMNQHDDGLDSDEDIPADEEDSDIPADEEEEADSIPPQKTEEPEPASAPIEKEVSEPVSVDIDDLADLDIKVETKAVAAEVTAPIQVPTQVRKRMVFTYAEDED